MVRKSVFVFALLALIVAPFLSAEDDRLKAIEARLAALEKENAQLKAAKQEIKLDASVQKAIENAVARTGTGSKYSESYLSYDRPLTQGKGIFVTGELLYMKPLQGRNDYATIGFDSGRGDGKDPARIASVEGDWNAGVRVGAGYHLPYDGWDVAAEYTYYTSENTSSVVGNTNATPQLIVSPLDGPFHAFDDEYVDIAQATTRIKYQVFNLDLGRTYKLTKNVTVGLFGGPELVWFKQNFQANFFGNDFPDNSASAIGGVQRESQRDFMYGMRIGGDGNLKLPKGFGIFGKASAALLFDDLHKTYFAAIDNSAPDSVITPNEVIEHMSQASKRIVPQFTIAAGISYDHKINERLNINARLGYEFTDYIGLIRREVTGTAEDEFFRSFNEGNFGLHGLTFRIKIDF